MESVNKKVIILSIILALVTTFLIYTYMKNTSVKPQTTEYIYTYAAAKTLSPNHMIVDSDLKQIKIEKQYLNNNAVINKANIIGKRLKDRIIEGEQILSDRLTGDETSKMSYAVSKGKRAVSINISEQSAVSFTLMPGDFVDVIASFDYEDIKNGNMTTHLPRITEIVIQNVEVLAVGGNMDMADTKTKDEPKTLTLAVSPQDSEKLVYASEFASIRLALRQSGDDKNVETKGIIRSDITSNKGVTVSNDGAATTAGSSNR